ncbi:hypothetical protein RhiirA1_538040 [Rhizophagus irregularis]|uniref:Hsp70 family protein n=1 Tax=Rhizophagus irregularis TaxID=588596 RepID=A0A2N0RID6_9GLOM|nr:hypothetical protein RhiirA1_538040 [Rhizophagus irregularis]
MEYYDYRVVVGIDFGTTHSGFAYAHKRIKTIIVHSEWQEYYGLYKIPTILLYDDKYEKVQSWGFNALKESIDNNKKPIELFKLYLSRMKNKPFLPNGFDYKKAIIDYLHEMGEIIKHVIINDWIDFYNQVLIVLTVPVEFDHTSIAIMRECAFKAGLLKDQYSRNLRFITEPEAAAIHCMKFLNENLSVGETFMVVDCGDNTIDSTTILFLEDEELNIMTERSRNDCGDNFIDQEFLKFLELKVGSTTINLVKENHYDQLQYMLKEFYRKVKMDFTGIQSEFHPIDLELDELCPALIQYCDEKYLDNMRKVEWNIKLKFEDIKSMFDPIIEKILKLIDRSNNNNCNLLLLIGILSESKYLKLRINQEFNNKIPIIYVPPNPITSIMEGAVQYGLKWIYDPERNSDGGALVSAAPYINNMRFQLTQSYDTIKNLEEEKKKFQDEFHESNNNLNEYKILYDNLMQKYDELVNKYEEKEQRLNNIQIKSSDTIKKLEEEKNKFQEEIQKSNNDLNEYKTLLNNLKKKYDDLVNENEKYKERKQDINEMQFQFSDTIMKLEEEKKIFQEEIQESNNNLNEYKTLHDNLKKKYDDLVNENEEYKEKEQRLNNIQIQFTDTIKKLEEEKKIFQEEIQESNNNLNEYKTLHDDLKKKYDDLVNENEEYKEKEQRLNNIQIQFTDTIKKLEEEKKIFQEEIQESNNNLNKYITLHDNLKKKYDDLVNEYKEKEQRLNDVQIQSSDTVKKLEKKFHDDIQESNNNLNEYKTLYDDLEKKYDDLVNENEEYKERKQDLNEMQIQSFDTIKKLEEEKKIFQEEIQESNNNYDNLKKKYDDLVNEYKEQGQHLNDIQTQSSDTIKKLEKKHQDDIHEYDNNHKSLYDNLQEKYIELTNKNNEESNQHEKLKNEMHQINNINQQYVEKIDQLRQSLELKENQIQDLEKEKEELDAKNSNLYYQLENLIQQNELLKNEKNELLLDDDNQNHISDLNNDISDLNNDISDLNNNLKKYITDLKQNVIINMEQVKKLLLLYKCPTKITNQKDDRLLIQAVLQRHIIETIFSYATKYFQTTTGKYYHLESDIINKTSALYISLTNISKQRTGNKEVTLLASTKLRQQIYSILNNHAFSDIIGDTIHEHPFIDYHKKQLNNIMNELRIIKDDQEKIASENLAATIIREFVKIFWFRLKVQEPVVQYAWVPCNAKVNKSFMEGINFSDNENLYVDLCYFPLTGKDLASSNRTIYTPAKVFTRKE